MWGGHSCPPSRGAAKESIEVGKVKAEKEVQKLEARSYSATSQSIASSRVLNVGNSRCEKLLKFS